jgi:hypothetical protein
MNQLQIPPQSVLECPHCPDAIESYLHHGTVTVYVRGEDAPQVKKTVVSDDGAAATSEIADTYSGNPSCRRDGLTISFWCELCHRTSELTLAQHKGQTEIAWR